MATDSLPSGLIDGWPAPLPRAGRQVPDALRRAWRRVRYGELALAVLLGCLTLIPIVYLIVNSFNIAPITAFRFSFGLQNWRTAYADPATLRSIWTTVWLALVRTSIAIPAAALIAWLIARTNMPGKAIVEFGMWVAFSLPVLSLTLGWILLLDPKAGLVNEALSGLPFAKGFALDIYSYWGIIWIHLVSRTIPIQVILMTPAFRHVGARLEEVSRMCGAGKLKTLARITGPVILPAILPLVVLSIIQGLQSLDVELLVGIPANIYVYGTRIYSLVQANPPRYGAATALGAAVLVVLMGLVAVYNKVLSRREFTTMTSDFSGAPIDLGGFRWLACGLCMALLAVGVGLPTAAAVLGSSMRRFGFFNIPSPFTSQHWSTVLHDPLFGLSLRNSALLGFGTALAAMLLCAAAAYVSLRGTGISRRLIDFFVWLPRGVPGVLLSLALLWLFLTTPLRAVVYGTVLGMVLALVVGELPSRAQLAKSALIQIGKEFEDASRMCGASGVRTAARVLAPLMAPMLLTIAALAFSAALSEFSQIVLIYSTATRPLSILTLEYIGNGNLEAAAVLGTFMTGVVACLALAVRWLGARLGPR